MTGQERQAVGQSGVPGGLSGGVRGMVRGCTEDEAVVHFAAAGTQNVCTEGSQGTAQGAGKGAHDRIFLYQG